MTRRTTRPTRATGLEPMLCFDLYAASRAMTAAYRPVLAPYDLTYPQYLVLVALWAREPGDPVAIKDLAGTLRLDHGTLTPLLRRLEQRGLLTRTRGADARSVRVGLTPGGDGLRSILPDVQCALTEATGLDAAEIAQVQQVLRRMTDTLAQDRPGTQLDGEQAG